MFDACLFLRFLRNHPAKNSIYHQVRIDIMWKLTLYTSFPLKPWFMPSILNSTLGSFILYEAVVSWRACGWIALSKLCGNVLHRKKFNELRDACVTEQLIQHGHIVHDPFNDKFLWVLVQTLGFSCLFMRDFFLYALIGFLPMKNSGWPLRTVGCIMFGVVLNPFQLHWWSAHPHLVVACSVVGCHYRLTNWKVITYQVFSLVKG